MPDAPDDQPEPVPNPRPDYEDFRDADGVVQWAEFRAAVAAYDPSEGVS